MVRYRDLGGDSHVRAFEIGVDSITVEFGDGSAYLYTSGSAGAAHLAQMQKLARLGRGLNGYINRYVRNGYARKLR